MAEKKTSIEIVLFTGFLGAGKTSGINHLITGIPMENTGILVNDFGSEQVDGLLIQEGLRKLESENGLDIFEVSGGSIFCSCKTASFVSGLKYFRMEGIHQLIIEASGMADPGGLQKILDENRLSEDYHIAHSICLIDGVSFTKLSGTLPVLENQVIHADTILINKCDLIENSTREELESTLRELNPDAEISFTLFGRIPPESLRRASARRWDGDIVSCNSPENRPGSMVLDTAGMELEEMHRRLKSLLPLSMRIKGWHHHAGKVYYISNNNNDIELDDSRSSDQSGITVIYQPAHETEILNTWKGVEID